MSEIFVLDNFRSKKNRCIDLRDFLSRAKKLKEEVSAKQKEDSLLLITLEDLEKMFEVRLNDFLLDNKLLSVQYFICAMFIASLLKETSFSIPESWYAVDYYIKNNETGDSSLLLNGANNCFLLSALFSERCERRGMRRSDYIGMGSGLYNQFYGETGKEVAYHMSCLFEMMSEATSECLKKI